MTDSQRLSVCPDCGGILEPAVPAWIGVLDADEGSLSTPAESATWRCLLCGYQRPPLDEAPATTHNRLTHAS